MDSDSASPSDVRLTLVAAVAENGVIGADGGLPWHYPEDLAHFKETTVGHPVIMGRVTYEDIRDRLGGPLPERQSIVLTSTPESLDAGEPTNDTDKVYAVSSVDDAELVARRLAKRKLGVDEAYVIGGASVYEQFLDRTDAMVITEIPESPDGDATYPDWDESDWTVTDSRSEGELTFTRYERR